MAKELKKGSFVRRLIAYVIDYVIIVVLVGLLSSPFVDSAKTQVLEKESNEIIEQYQSGKISVDEYVTRYSTIYYNLSRNTGVMTFITIIIDVLYFVVFQLYNKGQTLGKVLMKIKVVSTEGDLSMNQMIFRALIAYMILSNIINFALITFASKSIYTGVSICISMIQYIVMFISVIMATTKDGRTISSATTRSAEVPTASRP